MSNTNDHVEGNGHPYRTWRDWLDSDLVLGTLVVLFTITTALAAYLSSITEIAGDDFDLEAQNSLILGATYFLQTSVELTHDFATYTNASVLEDEFPDAAAELLEYTSPDFQEWLDSGGIPFEEEYQRERYATANLWLEKAQVYQEAGNLADEQSRRYERAAFVLAVGLALTAWASLYDQNPRLRFVFTLLAIPCLLFGIGILLATLVSSQL